MGPFAHGVYVNFLSDEPAAHVRVAYGEHKHARIAALKSKYDPANVFRFTRTSPRQADEHRRPPGNVP
jgi:Berberine and berberine like